MGAAGGHHAAELRRERACRRRAGHLPAVGRSRQDPRRIGRSSPQRVLAMTPRNRNSGKRRPRAVAAPAPTTDLIDRFIWIAVGILTMLLADAAFSRLG